MPNLLFEIGTEELPAGYIKPALKQMESILCSKLKDSRLGFNRVSAIGTPRRLTIFAEQIDDKQKSIEMEVMGPSYQVAFDNDNNLTNAGKGFAKSQGIDINDLKVKDTKKGKYCYAVKSQKGQYTKNLLPDILIVLIKSIDFPKKMIWRGKDVSFARPIRSLTAVFGKDIVGIELNGIKSNGTVRGNPYITVPEMYGLGRPINIERAHIDEYKENLKTENVIVDIEERKTLLMQKATNILSKYNASFEDNDLLEELTNLVEFPTAIECGFDERFLTLPDKVIIAAMKGHQRYCPVIDNKGKLYPKFVAVLNMDDAAALKAKDGNERVLRARLADARFFLEEDKKIPLGKRAEGLKDMMFHGKLGSYMERTNRIVNISNFIAQEIGFSNRLIEDVKRAAYLCKADLLTSMVGEFPELQGIMGREYALSSGESDRVAIAIEEHYRPRFANDKLPETDIGIVVSLADKIDMISGCFSIGLIPTGSQDPFALRRSVQGIMRIIEQKKLKLSLKNVLNYSLSLCPTQKHDKKSKKTKPKLSEMKYDNDKFIVLNQILDFFRDRLYQTFVDRGFRYDIINAVVATGYDDIVDLLYRLEIIAKIANEDYWSDLVTVVERTFNISKKQTLDFAINEDLLVEVEEKALWNTYIENKDKINSFIEEKDLRNASVIYSKVFSKPVHTFFDKVFVNAEDKNLRNNRLMILKKINELYSLNIADLSKIVVDKIK